MSDTQPPFTSQCQNCSGTLDVSAYTPFDRVECPLCNSATRIQYEFGRYHLQRVIGIGGMSIIYEAIDTTLERTVAVKILNADYSADTKRMAEFEKEAEVTASLSHPHIVKVYTVGQAFHRYFIVMELIPNGSLEDLLKRDTRLPEDQVLELALQTISGLQTAQEAGMIHRDLKPGNLLLDEFGRAKIVDFGLALHTSDGAATAEEVWATPYYTAPEALTGEQEDFRSDMWALAATLYHLLAGVPASSEESRVPKELLQAKSQIPSLSLTAPWVTTQTAATIDRAMAWLPKNRFTSYEDFASALKGEISASIKRKKSWWK